MDRRDTETQRRKENNIFTIDLRAFAPLRLSFFLSRFIAALLLTLTLSACHSASHSPAPKDSKSSSAMERIIISDVSFVRADSGRTFHPWGLNYGNHGRLIEDFWDVHWDTVESDFSKMKAMGANVVRVHLQFAKFMDATNKPNTHALQQYARLLHLAESTGLYLDITGLGCYRPSDVPKWYDALDESHRWVAQSNFWSAIAKEGNSSPAIFCYDLTNEPFVAGQARKPGEWRSGHLLGNGTNAFDFIQFINLNDFGRPREEIAKNWIACMTAAIRQHDKRVLITIGQLPWSREWHHLSGFDPAKIKDSLDFISVHIYPETAKPDEAMECLREFVVGKPIVIEETFPLSCGTNQLQQFMRASRPAATGWIGHYDGDSLAELDKLDHSKKISPTQSVYRAWLQMFTTLEPQFAK